MDHFFKKGMLLSSVLLTFCAGSTSAQTAKLHLSNAIVVSYSQATGLPNFIRLNPDQAIAENSFSDWAAFTFGTPEGVVFKSYDTKKDKLGFTHTRYREYVNEIPVEGTMLIAHSKEGRITMVNGDYYSAIGTSQSPAITEAQALTAALQKVNAERYKWENQAETEAMREALSQPDFSYFPKGELTMVHVAGTDYAAANIRLAYKFNIYAEKPLSRAYIFVDANSGTVISETQIIHTADVVGTANTKFSGTQPMTSNNTTGTTHRLQESTRGNGIKTFNMSNTTTYGTTDFTNTSSTWNITGANQAATDAHWGAEVTYDYYMNVHGRNSIDDAGFTLLSYVHYDVNYVNAFWDGSRMTYGDGQVSQGFLIMTALDVCGHEITHGLTENTAGLNGGGNGEPDALNEGFSDIVGTSIEWYARPSQHDWIIGADITCNGAGVPDGQGIRSMSNPNAYGQPDTYQGTNWDNSGEPHTNNGPSIFWYYLLCQGGSGTNDNGDAYNVSGITMSSAQMIAFRGLTAYFTPGTTYADARTYTIQAANDIYGGCSPEVIATTNAWYAVGVGPVFSSVVNADFSALSTSSCVLPFNVAFTNTSVNGSSAVWSFGDGGTSTQLNPAHTYTAAGTYNVQLTVSGACGTDSVLQSSYITVNPPASPSATPSYSCTSPASVTLGASGGGTLNWYATATGGSSLYSGTLFTTPSLSATTTYYVEDLTPGATGNAGPLNNSFGTGGMHNNTSTQYLVFDVLQPCTLQTVFVNSGAAGTRNVMLWNSAGALLQTIPVTYPAGTGTVTLNLHLNPGTGYRIGGTSMNLYRNNSGPAYPYSFAGTINITGSSAGAGYYYYFYNWQVQNDPCVSVRTPVTATIGGPAVSYASAVDTVCVTDAAIALSGGMPSGGSYSGTGVSGGTFDPAMSGAGAQTITYTYSDANSCSQSATQTIYVDACTTAGINVSEPVSGMKVYPNPANDFITVELGMSSSGNVGIKIMNALGQIVAAESRMLAAGNSKLELSLEQLDAGIYFVEISTSATVSVQRITKN
ncbi:MAG: type sorting protein [Bacteroidetes bacterium]|nr:type sorting protein [Bacteroidota bacterium]